MTQRLHDSLDEVERLLGTTGELLLRGDAVALEDQAGALRHAMLVLAQVGRGLRPDAALRERLSGVARQLARQRDALARRGAQADRAVATVLPGLRSPTYQAPGGAAGFRSPAARIYSGTTP